LTARPKGRELRVTRKSRTQLARARWASWVAGDLFGALTARWRRVPGRHVADRRSTHICRPQGLMASHLSGA